MSCYHKTLRISYKDHVANEEVHAKIQWATGPHEEFLTIVKRCKVKWYGHVFCSSLLATIILHGHVSCSSGLARRQHQGMDRPGNCQVPEDSGEQRKMEKTGCEVICGAPTTLAVKG